MLKLHKKVRTRENSCSKLHAEMNMKAGPEAVHTNATVKQILQQEAQKKFERTHSREEFMNLVGRNYLELEVDEEEMYGYTE